ncbi:MAG: precorrin-2 C(20)-methyltransferase [Clostridiaceae bacterium]|nr:precorrin-2 C(20)-methyltransferase [Butyricicoccus pullicaecorum]MBS7224008.1 precorrin-2 C(20)-methyltransferase [Clostridiaceae bacterium]
MNKGILYGIGVGPGDPELMTRKAVRLIQECDIIAAPQSEGNDKTAMIIAEEFVKDKPVLYCDMPMTRDQAKMDASHDQAADDICALLDEGKNVVFLTLGDPTIYSTYWYVHKRVLARGYDAQLIPGVPSFCAAAAAAGVALVEGSEMLHIVPASHTSTDDGLGMPGTKVLMKAGRSILDVREKLRADGKLAGSVLVERATMQEERVVKNLDELEDPTGYFSVIIVKEEQK